MTEAIWREPYFTDGDGREWHVYGRVPLRRAALTRSDRVSALLLAALAAVIGCGNAAGPAAAACGDPAAPLRLEGAFVLQTVNGAPLPWGENPNATTPQVRFEILWAELTAPRQATPPPGSYSLRSRERHTEKFGQTYEWEGTVPGNWFADGCGEFSMTEYFWLTADSARLSGDRLTVHASRVGTTRLSDGRTRLDTTRSVHVWQRQP